MQLIARLCVVSCALSQLAVAAEPTVRNLDLRGLQVGGETTIAIDGADLGSAPRLLLPFPDAKVTLKSGNTATKASFQIALPNSITPGVYQLRLATDDGVTAPQVLAVDQLPQVAFGQEIKSLPVAMHGTVSGSNVLETRFTAKKDDELIVEVEAQRLGSKLRPVLHVLDKQRRQLVWSWPVRRLAGDTRLSFKVAADGEYSIQLHDVEYQAAAPSYFRLKVGAWHFAETAFPPAIERGKTANVTLVGRMPSASVEMNSKGAGQVMAAGWPTGAAASGPRVSVMVSDIPEHLEQTGSGSLQEIPALPASINGRLLIAGEQDRFKVAVVAGEKLRLELLAERLGSPIDAVLILEDEKGKQLARGDDSPGSTDAVLEYTVPEKMTHFVVAVSDLLGRGSDASIYRLTIAPAVSLSQQDFRLLATTDRIHLTKAGRAIVPIVVERRGYEGAVQINASGLPTNVVMHGSDIPEGAQGCLLSFEGGDATTVNLLTLTGRDATGKLTRDVVFEQHPLGDLQPWLRSELAIAVAAEQKFQIDWSAAFSADATLPLAGKVSLPVKVIRPEGDTTSIRLKFLAAQIIPKNGNNPDLARSLRLENANVEIAADKSEAELSLLVPADLASRTYDIAVVGELLSKDKKNVLATAYTSPRRMKVQNPLVIEVANTTVEESLNAKQGATVKLPGKIQRGNMLKGAVTVSAVGLPAGVRADNVVIKEDASDFEIKLIFPASFKPQEVAGVKLAASIAPDSTKPQQLLKANEVPIVVKLNAN